MSMKWVRADREGWLFRSACGRWGVCHGRQAPFALVDFHNGGATYAARTVASAKAAAREVAGGRSLRVPDSRPHTHESG